ncbi:kinesin-domain-containing protein [Polychaeton citri CBS 116435]|uniref:Kinesin-like protein n=1 Tax=Polychaeton citri CBS 116435 TaxID=1314669 RepID=A0A9P4ULQ2_9PEZI|nr:kinesin-domain-containing protein [Polychaeton citri CBS 116435]
MGDYHSSATAPSLRSRVPVIEEMVEQGRPMTPGELDGGGNVKVVVRVRKFVPRELERRTPCLIHMNPATQQTTLSPPIVSADSHSRKTYEEKKFTFDNSFWSHDEEDAHYAHQEDIYRSFGEEFLEHNFDGYHTCIFAYGQTGSGKSYTMMGTPDQPGLIPRTCRGLFEKIEEEQNGSITYNVHVSYFEIYNEHVKDLLTPKSKDCGYLKIRESKLDGVYVQNLTDEQVKNYEDIERLMMVGDANRTTASTKMNDTSSRSHAVFTLTLKQIQHDLATDTTIERLARMRLVDLAGSERANRTEATGQRLREGGNINQSLTTLGRVIAALADPKRQKPASMRGSQNQTKRRAEVVPYRDSVLTWLLKDSLGGNSKTAMVACISPSDYEETLSTLRYADQAKRIRTRAHVNQDAVSAAERDQKIVEMQETIRALQLSVNAAATRKRDEADRARDELEDYQRQVGKMQRAMDESRAISEVKIRALTLEVDEIKPQNEALRLEVESLRRHLRLVVGELKDPIVLPKMARDSMASEEDDEYDSGMGEDSEYEEEEGGFEHEAWQVDVDDLLKDLGLFKRKIADDKSRFPHGQPPQPGSLGD